MMPPEWFNKPELTLTTADLLEAMRQQIVFATKDSKATKQKRLKALINEVALQYDNLSEAKEQLATNLEKDLNSLQEKIHVSAITAVSARSAISAKFLIQKQKQ